MKRGGIKSSTIVMPSTKESSSENRTSVVHGCLVTLEGLCNGPTLPP